MFFNMQQHIIYFKKYSGVPLQLLLQYYDALLH